MEIHERSLLAATRTHLARKDADAPQIAASMVSTWQRVDAALSPIIGYGGVAALYWRSLCHAGQVHPWLAGTHEGVQMAMDLAALNMYSPSRAALTRPLVAVPFRRRSTSCWLT
ncbi:MAG TPA: hypothetical protein VGO27_11535 [Candidatus Acidoferrum sp.]|jgi:hypothetical protein|nr:hypothetical protein [Candidatus Acidoferrum sp.]